MGFIKSALSIISTYLPEIISLIAILGLTFNKVQERKNDITSSYFSKMAAAYERYYESIIAFVYHANDATRDELACATYIAVLYASERVAIGIQAVTKKAFERSSRGQQDVKEVEAFLAELSALLHEDVAKFRTRVRS